MPEDRAYNESAAYNEQRDEGDDVEAHSATHADAPDAMAQEEPPDVEGHASATYADSVDAMAQEEPPDVEGHSHGSVEYTE